MKNLAVGMLFAAFLVACGGGEKENKIILPDVINTTCDPLMQTGCAANQKCTWIVDATTPQYVGHIGCAAAGDKGDAETCMYGMPGETGYDNCQAGFVCSSYKPRMDGTWGEGFCKAICDHQGGAPMCDSNHVCVRYSQLFKPDANAPTVAGVCDVACDPFSDNDFDGSGTVSMEGSATKCPGERVGCYGGPSFGTAPVTGWSCTNDINYDKAQPTGFRHRVRCDQTNMCGDAIATSGYINSCNQGYLPLLYESYAVDTVICTAMCAPLNCYSGNCGTQSINRFGMAPNACTDQNRVAGPEGFNTGANGDHCQYLWTFEIDRMAGTFLRSPTSDTLGFCVDHDKWVYDSNNDGAFDDTDMKLPACSTLMVTGSHLDTDLLNPSVYWGAKDAALGCVNTATAGIPFQGKATIAKDQLEKLDRVQRPRALYNREFFYKP